VWSESYVLSDLAVSYPAEGVVGGEEIVDDTQALVSYRSRWTGSVYPGEAKCRVSLIDVGGSAVVSHWVGFAHTGPRGSGEMSLTVPRQGEKPVSASAVCGPGTRSTGRYVFSECGSRLSTEG
jgi:hypothetical protein